MAISKNSEMKLENYIPQLMNCKQVREFLGYNIGRDKIFALMRSNILPSIWLGNRLVTSRKQVEEFAKELFEKPIQNGIIESVPVGYLDKIVKGM